MRQVANAMRQEHCVTLSSLRVESVTTFTIVFVIVGGRVSIQQSITIIQLAFRLIIKQGVMAVAVLRGVTYLFHCLMTINLETFQRISVRIVLHYWYTIAIVRCLVKMCQDCNTTIYIFAVFVVSLSLTHSVHFSFFT